MGTRQNRLKIYVLSKSMKKILDFLSVNFQVFGGEIFSIQSTPVISKSKGLSGILRDIRSSTYQICGIDEYNKSNNI